MGNLIIILTLMFAFGYNAHFGWNLFPQSIFEIFCDVFAISFFLIGAYISKYYQKKE